MGQAFTPGLVLSADTVIQRVRELPIPGNILCTIQQQVQANEIIAKASLPGELFILRIPEKLGLEPSEVMNGLMVKEGDQVTDGMVICEHAGLFGLFKSRYHSQFSGTVELISAQTGHVGIRAAATELTLNAYISGKVVSIDKGKSVTIQSRATLVQGIFGVGGERRGALRGIKVEAGQVLSQEHIPQAAEGQILYGGTRPTIAALRQVAHSKAHGLIVGAIDDQALKEFLGFDLGVAITGDEDIPFSLIITEGFGSLAISDRVLNLLTQCEGREASMNGATQVRAGALRPEIVVSKEDGLKEGSSTAPSLTLDIGRKIRIIRVPYFGKKATVTALPSELQQLETGAYARVLKAKLENGKEVIVPRANVEIEA